MFSFPEKKSKNSNFQYEKNLLQSVTLQLNYPKNDTIVENQDFWRNKLADKFINVKSLIKGEFRLSYDEGKTNLFQKSTKDGLEFRTKDNKQIVAFSTDMFTYTILQEKYTNFHKIFNELKDLFFPLFEKEKIILFNRLAIRKINIVEFVQDNKSSLSDALPMVFNDTLVDNMLFTPCVSHLKSGLVNLSFQKDDYQLNIRYGLMPNQQVTQNHQILFDIDLFRYAGVTNLDDVGDILTKINDEIFNVFHWGIKDSLINSLCLNSNKDNK